MFFKKKKIHSVDIVTLVYMSDELRALIPLMNLRPAPMNATYLVFYPDETYGYISHEPNGPFSAKQATPREVKLYFHEDFPLLVN